MIEKDVIQSPFYLSLEGTFLELKSVIRTLHFIEEKTPNYDQQKISLYPLSTQHKRRPSQGVKCDLQKGFTVSYSKGAFGLSTEQQRFSFKSSSTRSVIYAKDTKPNSESSKELKPSIFESYKGRITSSAKGDKSDYENRKSRALQCNVSRWVNRNINQLKINSLKLFGINKFIGSYLRNSALNNRDIMSISVLIKAQFSLNQKPNAPPL